MKTLEERYSRFWCAFREQGIDDETAAAFFRWNDENPKVYRFFESLALNQILNGARKGGAKDLAEKVRWDKSDPKNPKQRYKLDNRFVSYLVRVFEIKHPQHVGFFETRSVKGLAIREAA